MPDGAEFSIDAAKLDKDADRLIRSYLSAGTQAVAVVTRRLEQRFERSTREVARGRLWRAWKSATFPRSGPARDPAGEIWIDGGLRTRAAITFLTQPGVARSKSGFFLAIPLPAAGMRGRGRGMTPAEWERMHGVRLRFVYRQGKPSLLVAPGGTTNARTGGFRQLTAGKRGRVAQGRAGSNPLETAVVPIFILLPMVRFRNAFAIEPMVRQAEGELPGEFLSALPREGVR